jgi:parallel beta-helix repeat protein
MVNHASQVASCSTYASASHASSSCYGRPRPRLHVAALALAVLTACLASTPARADSAPTTCDKVASPQGSDAGTGSSAAPFRTAQELVNALSPGQVGCLAGGTYAGGLSVEHGGTSTAPIVLRSVPGERALITGRVYVQRGSNYVTVADVNLDGNYQSGSELLPSPTINANHVTFEADDVTNDNTTICFVIGSATWGTADSTVISEDHIHNCGVLPSNNYDHGIYVEDATNTRIVGNLIDRNAARGIQLYPSSTGAVISDNVISENGEGIIFSGEEGVASNDNIVEHNLVVNSLIRRDIESWYPSGNPLGVGNVAQDNCVSTRGIDTSAGGFSAVGNITASSSEFVATENGGYRPVAGSACAGVVPALVNGGVEGTSSGGAPTPVGKASGGGVTPTPGQAAPAGGSTTSTTGQEAPAGGSTPALAPTTPVTTPVEKAPKGSAGTTGAPKHRKHRGAARKAGPLAKAARAGHAAAKRRSRAKASQLARRRHSR